MCSSSHLKEEKDNTCAWTSKATGYGHTEYENSPPAAQHHRTAHTQSASIISTLPSICCSSTLRPPRSAQTPPSPAATGSGTMTRRRPRQGRAAEELELLRAISVSASCCQRKGRAPPQPRPRTECAAGEGRHRRRRPAASSANPRPGFNTEGESGDCSCRLASRPSLEPDEPSHEPNFWRRWLGLSFHEPGRAEPRAGLARLDSTPK